MKTYWFHCPRGFGNEYSIGVASDEHNAQVYKAGGYERIRRDQAIHDMIYRGDEATTAHVCVELDGKQVDNRWEFTHSLK